MTIDSPFGTARGVQREHTQVFKGIPFATAARFQPPQRITSWDTELDATAHRAQCPQVIGMVEQALGASSLPMDEQCLHLNVFTPQCDDAARPVLVWIHGGGYTSGSGSMPWYDGSALCERGDVVVVTLNYRLGALGFAGTTNCGIRDQIAALQWVRDGFAAFGGDPDNVTIFGESAGGSAVVSLFATPAATGLFRRGFAMSPSLTQLRSRERAESTLGELLAAAGASSLDALADVPLQEVLDIQGQMLASASGGIADALTTFSPAVDDDLFDGPIAAAAAENPAPLVLGTTRDEMALFTTFSPALASIDEAGTRALFAKRFGEGTDAAIAAYRAARPGAGPRELVSAMQTDEVFRAPARGVADGRISREVPTWMYWFTWPTPAFGGSLGSCHAVDIAFAFHNLDRTGVTQFTGTGEDRVPVADAYSDAVLSFATAGDPGWPRYDAARRATRRFDVESETLDDPEPELRELWSQR
ncbi:MAG: putative carboxylesterase [Ilumatobacteraceae bacterium]|nr:putative carboxylesterase [Ilumatobacteraceae bacterium]